MVSVQFDNKYKLFLKKKKIMEFVVLKMGYKEQ